MSNIYFYARVSSRTQSLSRQLVEVKKHYPMLSDDCIVTEKASGKNFIDRTEYLNLRNKLKAGDLLIICSLDRLGRNMKEVSAEWEYLTANKIDIDVLDMPILNTRNNLAGLTGELINKLIVTILSYVGEKERNSIKERQRQGIDNCLSTGETKTGNKYGRPQKQEVPKKFKDLVNKGFKPVEIQKICGISKRTYYRYMDKLNSK